MSLRLDIARARAHGLGLEPWYYYDGAARTIAEYTVTTLDDGAMIGVVYRDDDDDKWGRVGALTPDWVRYQWFKTLVEAELALLSAARGESAVVCARLRAAKRERKGA